MALILGVAVSVLLAVITYLQTPDLFTAVETIRVAYKDPHGPTSESTPFDLEIYRIYRNTQRELILQPFALGEALTDRNVAQEELVKAQVDPVEWLVRHLDVKSPEGTEMIAVSVTLPNAQTAHRIARSVVGRYMIEVVERDRQVRDIRVDTLKKHLSMVESRERRLRSDLYSFVDAAGQNDDDTKKLAQQMRYQHAALIHADLHKVELDLIDTQFEIDFQQDAESTTNSIESPDRLALQRKIERLQKRQSYLKVELNKWLADAANVRSSVDIEIMRREIESCQLTTDRVRQEIDQALLESQSPIRITQYPSSGAPVTADSTERIRLATVVALIGLFPMLLVLLSYPFRLR